ncbi:MAG: acetate/propionate family kinase [Thermoanaerobaculia bacterium]|nr:acetate/propionate family kinase [Thermoanaerobaculia bacterium]
MKVLVINCGSSSVKYRLIDTETRMALSVGVVERIGDGGTSHRAAVSEILERVDLTEIEAVGHRVVHGGERFHDATLIDDQVVAAIEECVPLAPLHNPANLAGIRLAREALPSLPHVAIFDTAFHRRLPRRAIHYALDLDLAQRLGIRRYGFHGPSHSYVARRAAEYLERDLEDLRLITLHLGNGASACAIELGASVETSMGLTPLEGLVMGTRCGDLDPGAVLQLVRELGVDETDRVLNRESGLAGLSGLGNDLRDIEEQAAAGNDRARLAITVYAHAVRRYIGAYAAAMGGVDAIVLTGGIGENSAQMRRRILQQLDFFGVRLDEDRNHDARVSAEVPVVDVSTDRASVRTLVVKTNEELMTALQTARVARGDTEVRSPGPVPIAISGRHVHLDRASMDALFGEGSELTVYKNLSQPGQYAARETLTLVGPRGQIEGVRVLGPLRKSPQIEISRTDEFALGVDAPIRASGKTQGSAPVTLVGPAGTLHLNEGLICAWRHIHMHPKDAEAYGVENGDEVEVAIQGGERDLTFGDVLVRVKDSYVLEMHIDTDEANAAELSRGAGGDLLYDPPDIAAAASLERRRTR